MEKKIKAHNGYVFFKKLSEKRTIAGDFEMIREGDNDYRSEKGQVVEACDSMPLKEGDKFLYEQRTAYEVYVDGEMYWYVHGSRIIGKIIE